jgi:hypothetical protein
MSETAAAPGTAEAATSPYTSKAPPFKGLEPFSERDSAFFFSRDAERDVILGSLMAARLLLLYGPSGVGKSSLIHAGLVHTLHEIAVSNQQESGVPELAVVVLDTWRDDPVRALKALLRGAGADAVEDPGLSPSDNLSLRDTLAAVAERVQGEVYVILDQFEEFFLYHGADNRESSFYREFPRAVNDPLLTVRFLISLREDALGRLDLFKMAIPTLFTNRYRLNYLTRSAARKAIDGPVDEYNERHPDDLVIVGPGLVDRVLADVQLGHVDFSETGQAGAGDEAGRIATPYLQLVMRRLWERETGSESRVLRLDTLQNPETGLGGVEKIVRAHLDEKLATLSEDDQDVAVEIFRYLITRSGTKYAYSIASLADPELTGLPEDRIARVVNQLSQGGTRILSNIGPPPGAADPGLDRYQIFHDVLAPAVLDWRRRHVGAREKEAIRRHELEIREGERREMGVRRARLLRWGYAGVTVAALGLTLLSVYALRQRGAAEREKSAALAARDSANAARAAAENVLLRTNQQRDSYAALLDSLRAQNATAFAQALGAITESDAQVIALDTASGPGARTIPLVYIQFQGSMSRELMNQLRQDLAAAGYAAPGVERIRPPFESDVRYFFPADEEVANAVASRTQTFFMRRGCQIWLPAHRFAVPGAREGQVEVWVSLDCPARRDSAAAVGQ